MTKIRVLIFIITLVVVATIGTLVFYYARGYRFDIKTLKFTPNGLLVVKSDPDGAQVFINGELRTATNANIFLPPNTYDVSIRKEGYLPWYKRMVVEKEVVIEADASLFRAVPSLSAITFSGVINPLPFDDFTKIAYAVPPIAQDSNGINDKAGLWVIETVNFPLGFSTDPKRITDGDLSEASWIWSPDGREILLTTKTGVFLLDAGSFTPQSQRINIASQKDKIIAEWEKRRKTKLNAQMKKLPKELADILERKAKNVVFSPDETKVLYTASDSATLKENLIKPVPGSSTQKQERNIKTGRTYVYDIKEDRNFLIEEDTSNLAIGAFPSNNSSRRLTWFATSRHLVLAEQGKITIMDYDGTNRQTVYSGSYVSPYAFPTASTQRLLVLTNLGADSSLPNLYSLSLK